MLLSIHECPESFECISYSFQSSAENSEHMILFLYPLVQIHSCWGERAMKDSPTEFLGCMSFFSYFLLVSFVVTVGFLTTTSYYD